MSLRIAAFVTAGIAALALAGVPAAAHGFGHPGHGPGGGGAEHILHMAKTLDLTAAQHTQIESIAEDAKAGAIGKTWKSMRTTHESLASLIHDPAATDDQVRDAAAAVAALGTELAVLHHKMAVEIAAVLTPDQKAKLAELKATFKEHHSGPHSDDSAGF